MGNPQFPDPSFLPLLTRSGILVHNWRKERDRIKHARYAPGFSYLLAFRCVHRLSSATGGGGGGGQREGGHWEPSTGSELLSFSSG